MAIKSKYFVLNNCYNEILKLFGDVWPKPHKFPKDMYYSKIIVKSLDMDYEILVCVQKKFYACWGPSSSKGPQNTNSTTIC